MEGSRCGSDKEIHRHGTDKSNKILGDYYLGEYQIDIYVNLGKHQMQKTECAAQSSSDKYIKEPGNKVSVEKNTADYTENIAAKHIKENYRQFTDVIPSSVAITNARESLGDHLNRDGFHLDLSYGRLTAALTWFAKITGTNLDNLVDATELLEICHVGIDSLRDRGVGLTPTKLLEICIDSAKNVV